MQVSKGGWGGNTFAQAKLNDSSGGKKSKRRSKEERKGMVETFIRRYQSSNNGSFPSLNLTHKEVGGSYYTVREIFREVIQENRVLAPPKLPQGEHNMENLDSFLETYPLGTISFDPNIHALPPKDNQTLLNEYEFRREKVLNSRRISELHGGRLDNDIIITGNPHTTGKNEEFDDSRYSEFVKRVDEGPKAAGEIIDAESSQISRSDVVETIDTALTNNISEEPKHTELLIEQGLERENDEIKEAKGHQDQVRPLSDNVVVEAFPLRPVSSTLYKVNEKPSEKDVLDGDLELATRNDQSFVQDEIHMFDDSTEMVETKLEKELPLPESNPVLSPKTHHQKFSDNIVVDVNSIKDDKFEDVSPAEEKASYIPNGISSQNLDGNNSSSFQQWTFEDSTANEDKSDFQPSGTGQKQTVGKTLNRINLESWEAASKKSHSQEANPIVSFIKTVVAAFVKFWSE